MDLCEYQSTARQTAVYPDQYGVIYPALGLGGESGEVLEKVKKIIRDDNGEGNYRVDKKEEFYKVLEITDKKWSLSG